MELVTSHLTTANSSQDKTNEGKMYTRPQTRPTWGLTSVTGMATE